MNSGNSFSSKIAQFDIRSAPQMQHVSSKNVDVQMRNDGCCVGSVGECAVISHIFVGNGPASIRSAPQVHQISSE